MPGALASASMLGCVTAANTVYKTYDASHLRAAGIGNGQQLTASGASGPQQQQVETAGSSLRWDAQRPETPAELKKYRQSTLHTPGVVFKHFGAADDTVDRDRTYGRVRPAQPCDTTHTAGDHVPLLRCTAFEPAQWLACSPPTKTAPPRRASRHTQTAT